jgi:hypothetical protein
MPRGGKRPGAGRAVSAETLTSFATGADVDRQTRCPACRSSVHRWASDLAPTEARSFTAWCPSCGAELRLSIEPVVVWVRTRVPLAGAATIVGGDC